jgi:plastocyanin
MLSAIITTVIAAATLPLVGCTRDVTDSPGTIEYKVIDIRIVDTTEYQGFIPDKVMVRAGEQVELRVLNEDNNTRLQGQSANSHPIVLRGSTINKGIPSLSPGQTKSITFRAEVGIYYYSCANPACDIHTHLSGTILVE